MQCVCLLVIWRFPQIGVPPVLVHFHGIFPIKNHPAIGVLLFMETHILDLPILPHLSILIEQGHARRFHSAWFSAAGNLEATRIGTFMNKNDGFSMISYDLD